jgi:hypothetical protein
MHRRLGALLAVAVLGTAGAAVTGAAPAAAGVPGPPTVWGFAFLQDPTPARGTVLDPTRQWGSWKTAFPAEVATVDRVGAGSYVVRFPRIASRAGIAHVSTVLGNGPAFCQLARWYPAGADELVEVRCFHAGGAPEDTRFAVEFVARTGPFEVPGGTFAYANVNADATVADLFNPSDNSADGVISSAEDDNGPFYITEFPGIGDGELGGSVQVTAVSDQPRFCHLIGFDVVFGQLVVANIRCFDASGLPVRSAFTLTYHRERAVFGELAPPKRFGYTTANYPPFIFEDPPGPPPPGLTFNSSGSANTVQSLGVGRSRFVFGQLGVAQTHIQISAFRPTVFDSKPEPKFCALSDSWRTGGGDATVDVTCYLLPKGDPVDATVFATFTSGR